MAIQSNFPAIKPSLLLDFANTKQLDPRITYTRASTATFYNGVTTAKAEENLFSYSQTFSNAYWGKQVTTLTDNAAVAPDGTSTAASFPAVSSGLLNSFFSSATIGTSGQPLVISIYAKANTASFLQFTPALTILASAFANFDLSTGTAGNIAGTGLTSSITSVGNGWYRCVVTIASSSGTGAIVFSLIDSNTSARQSVYTGTAGNNIFVWGAQAEVRSVVTSYTATTTQPITNYIPALQTAASGVARFDHNPTTDESLGLLIEDSRTNLVTYSEQLNNAAWTKTNTTITADTIIAPDGTLTGDKVIESTATGFHFVRQNISVSATSHTISFFAKASERSVVLTTMDGGSNSGWFNLSAGTAGLNGVGTVQITSVGNGWYRCSFTATLSAGTAPCFIFVSTATSNPSYAGDGFSGAFIWGAQLEVGAFSTSYIPTVASQVTRAADVATITGTNFSSWYSAGEGTLYGEGATSDDSYPTLVSINNGTTAQVIELQGSSTAVNMNFVVVATSTQASLASTLTKSGSKCVGVYKANDFASSVNASSVSTDTSGVIPLLVDRMTIGAEVSSLLWNGTIKKVAYYPMRVTNAQLQALTS